MTEAKSERLAYTVREVAVALGISESAVYQMIRRGQLACVKIGSRKFIPASVFRVLQAGEVQG